MRARQFLIEFSIEKTAEKIGRSLYDRLRADYSGEGSSLLRISLNHALKLMSDPEQKTPDYENVLIGHITRAALEQMVKWDPRGGKYTLWIIRTYINKGIRFYEDFGRVKLALAAYHSIKQSGYFKRNPEQITLSDINAFKSLDELETFVEGITKSDEAPESEKERRYERLLIETGAVTILADTPKMKVVIPRTKEAAIFFGRNTRWCTSAKENNQFSYYNEEGPLYIVLDKASNRRWQLHFHSQQYMDEKDNPIESFEAEDGFPEEFFNYIDLNIDNTTKLQILIDELYHGARLPKHFHRRILDEQDRDTLSYILIRAVSGNQSVQGGGPYVNFLIDYLVERFHITRPENQTIQNFGRDFLSFYIECIRSNPAAALPAMYSWISYLVQSLSNFKKFARQAHYAFVRDKNDYVGIVVIDQSVESITRFQIYSSIFGVNRLNDDDVEHNLMRIERQEGHISNFPIFKTAYRYMYRFIPPKE